MSIINLCRVPSYTTSDGSKPKFAPRGTSDWYNQAEWSSNVNGICQETCRDLGHTQYGLKSTLNAAATAATQGVALFDEQVIPPPPPIYFRPAILFYSHFSSFIYDIGVANSIGSCYGIQCCFLEWSNCSKLCVRRIGECWN